MAHEIKMPQLSDTMDSGKILSWSKEVGDSIERGDVLAEVETDKANLEIESFHEGTLLKITVPAGEAADVGATIAYIGESGEETPETSKPEAQPPESKDASEELSEEPEEAETKERPEKAPPEDKPSAPSASSSKPAASSKPIATTRPDERILASPLAKKIAQERNVDLATLQGSGPQGRIIKKDVEAAATGSAAPPSPSQSSRECRSARETVVPESSSAPLSKMRATIARRMQESMSEIPHFYSTISIDMKHTVALRKRLKEQEEYSGISLNHFVIAACAYALQREPRVNCAYRDDAVYSPGNINIGIVTAVEDGLLIPVIQNTDQLLLKDLVFEAKAAVDRARAGRPNSTDLTGGTFCISNMGMFGVESFTAIINPGQGAILAVGAATEVPVVEQGVLVPGVRMKATLSVDHRIIDGAIAGAFLKHLRDALEFPALLGGIS